MSPYHFEHEINTQQHGHQMTNPLCADTCLKLEGRDANFSRDPVVFFQLVKGGQLLLLEQSPFLS